MTEMVCSLSLLLLLFALSTLLAFLSEEFTLCLEPNPTTLDVSGSIVHRHLLLDLSSFCLSLGIKLFFALLAFLCVDADLVVDFLDLLSCCSSLLLNLSTLFFDAVHLSFTLGFLGLELSSEFSNSLLEMLHHGGVDFFLGRENLSGLVDLLLEFILQLGVNTVFTRLLSLVDHVSVLDVQVLFHLSLVLLAL